MERGGDDSGASVHVLRKWRVIGVYWAAQALFIAAFVPLWVMQGETVNGQNGRPMGSWRGDRLWDLLTSWEAWGVTAVAVLALMVLQAAVVWPVRKPRGRAERGWPLRLSIGVAALLGAVLACGLYAGLITLVELAEMHWSEGLDRTLAIGFWSWLAISYVGGGVLMYRFCVRRLDAGRKHEDVLGRLAATLFVGTLVESVAILPIDLMFRRKQDCYCFAGTFWAYAGLVGVGLVTLGPAVLLPALSRRRKRWYAARCDCCGYDMRGAIDADREIERCPECGAGWKRVPNEPAARAEE